MELWQLYLNFLMHVYRYIIESLQATASVPHYPSELSGKTLLLEPLILES